jgi:hypothetical protein
MRQGPSLLVILIAMVFSDAVTAADVALTHVRIYASPDAEPVADGTLLIHDGRIQRMGPVSPLTSMGSMFRSAAASIFWPTPRRTADPGPPSSRPAFLRTTWR